MKIIRNMKEILKGLKHKSELEPSTKYCPKCGSPKLKTKINWFIVPSQTYKCPECGYEGPIFMEKEDCKKTSSLEFRGQAASSKSCNGS